MLPSDITGDHHLVSLLRHQANAVAGVVSRGSQVERRLCLRIILVLAVHPVETRLNRYLASTISGSEEDLRREFAELRQRFDDERAARKEAEAARKADAESQSTQMSDMMRMMTALMSKNSGQEEERDRSAQVAPTTTDEEQEAPALSTPDEEQEAPASVASFQDRPERFFASAEADPSGHLR